VYGFHRGNFRNDRKNVRVATTFYLNWMGNGEESVEQLGLGGREGDVGIAHGGTISG